MTTNHIDPSDLTPGNYVRASDGSTGILLADLDELNPQPRPARPEEWVAVAWDDGSRTAVQIDDLVYAGQRTWTPEGYWNAVFGPHATVRTVLDEAKAHAPGLREYVEQSVAAALDQGADFVGVAATADLMRQIELVMAVQGIADPFADDLDDSGFPRDLGDGGTLTSLGTGYRR